MTYTRRILVISPFFSPHIGGSQRYMEDLYAHVVASHPDVKVDVLAYNTREAETEEVYRGMTVHRIPSFSLLKGQFVLPHPFALISFLLSHVSTGYTLVHANTRFFESTWWAWIYAKAIGAKSMVTDHVAAYPIHEHRWVSFIAHMIDHTIASWSLRGYDIVTATNKATQRFLTHTLGVPHVVLAYGGVDTKQYRIKRTPKRSVTITYAGRLIWSKGVTYLLDAIDRVLRKHNKNVSFVIAGAGNMEQTVRDRIDQKGWKKRVTFAGPLDAKGVQKLLATSDIFVHPSHHAEGFPNSLLEAAASGCFVIATDNAGTKEILENGIGGMLIPQENTAALTRALLWALQHSKQRRTKAAQGQTWVRRNFAWNKLSEEFYQQLICQPGDAGVHTQDTLLAMAG